MAIRWLDELAATDVDLVGGKAASLGELTAAGLPVPPGFVVTASAYQTFIETAEIEEELRDAVDVDPSDSEALKTASNRAESLILEASFPEQLGEEIVDAFASIESSNNDPVYVAVRSSATAEDMPDASFAGQQDTYLNVTGNDLLDRIQACWASLFTQRAIYYRNRQGYPASDVAIAVVVQQMIDSEKSGVMFTKHPSTGANEFVIEAAWGLGEAIVSGSVSPDNYILDGETGTTLEETIATKHTMMIRDAETGENATIEVPEDKQQAIVLDDAEREGLIELGRAAEDHYGSPQDIEWAIADGSIYVLQSRPVTTIPAASTDEPSTENTQQDTMTDTAETTSDEVLLRGLGASPGTRTGPVRIVRKLDHLDQVTEGDVLVTEMTTPDMVPAMQRAVALVTDEGGMTSHAAIVARELGVPAVVGTDTATSHLSEGQWVTIDGDKGTIQSAPAQEEKAGPEDSEADQPDRPVPTGPSSTFEKPMSATEVKVNVSIPSAAERAAATGADGVGLLRIEHMILSLGKTPERFIADHGEREYQDELLSGIRTVADAFYPRPVRVRTLDAPTDEFREMDGGTDEPDEHNPMLGFRGIRRSLAKPSIFQQELIAIRRLFELGYDNIEVMFPLVNDATDVTRAKAQMQEAGIDPALRSWGVMVETPASALLIDDIADTGIDFISFGTNDLTQYTLAVDRNNAAVADRFDELHPAVLKLITQTIHTCREHGINTSICGEAASKPKMVNHLVNAGITSLSPNIDAVHAVQERVMRMEQRLLLESVR